MTELEEYYNKFNEEKRLNSRHGRVEFITSMKYIHDCLGSLMNEKQLDLRSQIKILDVGAGTGRYSVPLAEEGYDVTALELVKHNLGRLKQKSDKVKAYQGNATKLKKFGNDEFDLTLVFGPMYHLKSAEEKLAALNEAKRVTKPGGYILVAYIMNEYSVITYAIKEKLFFVSKRGSGCPDHVGKWSVTCGYLDWGETRKEAIKRELYEELGLNLEIYPNEAIDHFCTIDDPSRDVRENIVSRYLIHVDYIATRKKLADKEINCDTVSRGGEPNEVDDIKFVPAEDIDSYDWAFNHDQVLKEILEYLETGRKPKYCEE